MLSFDLEANGYGAILATPGEPSDGNQGLMQRMAAMTAKPLASFSHEPAILPQTIVEIPPTTPAAEAPAGMIRIPGGDFVFKVQGTEIEGGGRPGVDVQYPWEDTPRRFHEHTMQVAPFFIDKYPGHQRPVQAVPRRHPLRARATPSTSCATGRTARYPAGLGQPPRHLGLARRCARLCEVGRQAPAPRVGVAIGRAGHRRPPLSLGKQLAARQRSRARHRPHHARPRPRRRPSSGASPYGVMDMVGNVWQWTDEFTDEHTRAAILRGGEYYQPQGSIWYFPQAYRNDEHSKLLLMAPGYDRSGGVGFRCVKDAL